MSSRRGFLARLIAFPAAFCAMVREATSGAGALPPPVVPAKQVHVIEDFGCELPATNIPYVRVIVVAWEDRFKKLAQLDDPEPWTCTIRPGTDDGTAEILLYYRDPQVAMHRQ